MNILTMRSTIFFIFMSKKWSLSRKVHVKVNLEFVVILSDLDLYRFLYVSLTRPGIVKFACGRKAFW